MNERPSAILEFLARCDSYVKHPVGNQPDAFLLGIMQPTQKDPQPAPSDSDSLLLSEDMIVPSDYLPEKP
jgi:hypothetical protein